MHEICHAMWFFNSPNGHEEEFIGESLSISNFLKSTGLKNWSLLTAERDTSIVGSHEIKCKTY